MSLIEAKDLHSAQEVMAHARHVMAERRATYRHDKTAALAAELSVIKAERDQYRAQVEELKGRLANLSPEQECRVIGALPRPVTVHAIVHVVSDFYKIGYQEIASDRVNGYLIEPRHVAIHLAKVLTRYSFPHIGKEIGGRHHTTCLHGHKKIERLRRQNPEFDQKIKSLIARFVTA